MVCAASPVTVFAVPVPAVPAADAAGLAVAPFAVVLAPAPLLTGPGLGLPRAAAGEVPDTADWVCDLKDSRRTRPMAVAQIARMTRRNEVPFLVRTRTTHDGPAGAGP